MSTFDPNQFVDDVGVALAAEASDDVKIAIYGSERLQVEITAFQHQAKEGLAAVVRGESTPVALEALLKARKSLIVAACQASAYSIERLVSKALERVVAKAREVAPKGGI